MIELEKVPNLVFSQKLMGGFQALQQITNQKTTVFHKMRMKRMLLQSQQKQPTQTILIQPKGKKTQVLMMTK